MGYKCVGEVVKPDTHDDMKTDRIKVSRKTLLREGEFSEKVQQDKH